MEINLQIPGHFLQSEQEGGQQENHTQHVFMSISPGHYQDP